jgi:hypothetical protein
MDMVIHHEEPAGSGGEGHDGREGKASDLTMSSLRHW